MASNMPLKCTVCPKAPSFSDQSHLLTHVNSKGHLAHYFKVRIRAITEPEARTQLIAYDQWYADWGIELLVSDRIQLKAKNERKPRTRSTVPKKAAASGSQSNSTTTRTRASSSRYTKMSTNNNNNNDNGNNTSTDMNEESFIDPALAGPFKRQSMGPPSAPARRRRSTIAHSPARQSQQASHYSHDQFPPTAAHHTLRSNASHLPLTPEVISSYQSGPYQVEHRRDSGFQGYVNDSDNRDFYYPDPTQHASNARHARMHSLALSDISTLNGAPLDTLIKDDYDEEDFLDYYEEEVPDEDKLATKSGRGKGAVLRSNLKFPGMGIFDSATEAGKRQRNQKKDESVIDRLDYNSRSIVNLEVQFDKQWRFKKSKVITGLPSSSSSPWPESPAHSRSRSILTDISQNPYFGQGQMGRLQSYEDDAAEDALSYGPLNPANGQGRRGFSVYQDSNDDFEDDEQDEKDDPTYSTRGQSTRSTRGSARKPRAKATRARGGKKKAASNTSRNTTTYRRGPDAMNRHMEQWRADNASQAYIPADARSAGIQSLATVATTSASVSRSDTPNTSMTGTNSPFTGYGAMHIGHGGPMLTRPIQTIQPSLSTNPYAYPPATNSYNGTGYGYASANSTYGGLDSGSRLNTNRLPSFANNFTPNSNNYNAGAMYQGIAGPARSNISSLGKNYNGQSNTFSSFSPTSSGLAYAQDMDDIHAYSTGIGTISALAPDNPFSTFDGQPYHQGQMNMGNAFQSQNGYTHSQINNANIFQAQNSQRTYQMNSGGYGQSLMNSSHDILDSPAYHIQQQFGMALPNSRSISDTSAPEHTRNSSNAFNNGIQSTIRNPSNLSPLAVLAQNGFAQNNFGHNSLARLQPQPDSMFTGDASIGYANNISGGGRVSRGLVPASPFTDSTPTPRPESIHSETAVAMPQNNAISWPVTVVDDGSNIIMNSIEDVPLPDQIYNASDDNRTITAPATPFESIPPGTSYGPRSY